MIENKQKIHVYPRERVTKQRKERLCRESTKIVRSESAHGSEEPRRLWALKQTRISTGVRRNKTKRQHKRETTSSIVGSREKSLLDSAEVKIALLQHETMGQGERASCARERIIPRFQNTSSHYCSSSVVLLSAIRNLISGARLIPIISWISIIVVNSFRNSLLTSTKRFHSVPT